ncbi:MAG: ABC-2 transporter permease [Propionibacteriaceae bacterium]|jgi:hypothetical protein|nr:ABC-2 transporter permease [Propionibacteriaceae bacterium]
MTADLIRKEFALSIPRGNYWWLAAVLLLLIPVWPFVIVFTYLFFGFFMILNQFDKINHDLTLCATLPIPKTGVVWGRALTVMIIEAVMVVASWPLAILRHWIWTEDNASGMNVNLAFYGFVLVMYAVFNLIYLVGTYHKAYGILWPIGGGTLIAVVVGLVLTTAPIVWPALSVINDRGFGHLGIQAVVFAVGLVVWLAATWGGWRWAAARYEHVDL